MRSEAITSESGLSAEPALRFGYQRQREIAIATRGVTACQTEEERDAAFAAFVRHDAVCLDVIRRWDITFATTLHRGGPKGFTLHLDSDSPEFPNERYDLNQSEVDVWLAERDGEQVPPRPDWPVVKPWASLDVPVFTVAALAKRWDCSASVVNLLMVTGELPAFKVGTRRRLVSADQVAEFERRPAVQSKEYAEAVSTMEHLPAAEVVPVVVLPVRSPLTRDIYSVQQIAERWAVSDSCVRRMIKRGQIRAFRTYGGKLLRVRADAVHAYELTRLPEVVSAEQQAKRDAEERRVQEAQNEMRLARRIERRRGF